MQKNNGNTKLSTYFSKLATRVTQSIAPAFSKLAQKVQSAKPAFQRTAQALSASLDVTSQMQPAAIKQEPPKQQAQMQLRR